MTGAYKIAHFVGLAIAIPVFLAVGMLRHGFKKSVILTLAAVILLLILFYLMVLRNQC